MTGIIYISKHGTTKKVAEKIKELINHDADLIDLRSVKNPDISKYKNLIIGGSIHAGNIQKRMQAFCELNLEQLLKKQIALFLCCMEEDEEKAKQQFENAYPKVLRNHSVKYDILGGEFLLDKMNFFEKSIIKKIAKTKENVHKIKEKKIVEFSESIFNINE